MKTLEQILPEHKTRKVIETAYEITTEMDMHDDQITSRSSLRYDLDLRYIGGGLFTNWEKSNFYINGKKSFTKVDEIYLKVAKPLNKLDFYYKNGMISEVKNYKGILKEWKVVRELINLEFYGEVVRELLNRTEDNYNDEERLCKLLSRDLVLQHLYTSTELNNDLIYTQSSKNKRKFLGVLDEIPVTYYEERTLSQIGDQLRIKTKGQQKVQPGMNDSLEKYFKYKVENFKPENLKSSIEADYIVDPDSLWINEAVVVHDVKVLDSNYKKNITLTIKRK